MSNDIFEMACNLVNPDGGELNEYQENEVQALVNFAKSCNADMQARIEKLEAGIRRIVNGEYDNARTIDAAEKFARELLRGDK